MKASELISFLKDIISNYGDFELITEYENIKDLEGVPHNSQKVIQINSADHYSVFREIDAPKESTGYANYDRR